METRADEDAKTRLPAPRSIAVKVCEHSDTCRETAVSGCSIADGIKIINTKLPTRPIQGKASTFCGKQRPLLVAN